MRYTPTPNQYGPFYIAETGEYCTAKYGYANKIPNDNSLAEVKIQTFDKKQIVICVAHKQEYPHRAYQPRDVLGIADTILNIYNWRSSCKSDNRRKKYTADYSDTPSKSAPNIPQKRDKSKITLPQILKTSDGYLVDGRKGKVDLYSGEAFSEKTIDKETGEIKSVKFRGMKSLHDSYRRMENKILFNLKPRKTVFVTLNFDKKYTIDEITTKGANLQRWLKRKCKVTIGIIVFQPCEDGSWHIHFLLCWNGFYHKKQVEKFRRDLHKWAVKYNNKRSNNMLDVKHLITFKDIMIKWSYLDPYHHRERAVYYPTGKQVFKQIGELQTPPKSILTSNSAINEFLQKIEASPMTCFNQQKIFIDSEGFHLRTIEYSYYTISLEYVKDICENSICKPLPWDVNWRKCEQLRFFAPPSIQLSSDEIVCRT